MLLETIQLGKRFGKRWAVNNLNLQIYPGDILGLLGPNGAGKSTTIRMLTGLISPSKGKIIFKGHNFTEHVKKNIRALIEVPGFYNYLSGLDNLRILARLSGIRDEGVVDDALQKVGLYARRKDKVGSYSHGMKQRLGIAQAIMGKPELVILDEPTNGLDPRGIKEIRELIRKLNQEDGITFLISSHLLLEVEDLCKRIAILTQGNLLVQGETRDLLPSGQSLEDFFIALTSEKTEVSV